MHMPLHPFRGWSVNHPQSMQEFHFEVHPPLQGTSSLPHWAQGSVLGIHAPLHAFSVAKQT
jgi:hypothetical protein